MAPSPRYAPLAALSTLAAAVIACSADTGSDLKVTNGKSTTRDVFPFVAEFNTGRGYCSATVIGPNAVLTAAHCVQGSTADRMQIKTGEGTFRVLDVKAHPTYLSTRGAREDLALLKIDGTHKTRSSICRERASASRDILIMGWGNFVYPAPTDTTGTLRYGFNTIDRVGGNGIEFSGTAQGPGDGTKVGAGTGDSGGPMFLLQAGHGLSPSSSFDGPVLLRKSTLVGVTSGGTSSGNTTFEMYADVCLNRDWIDQTARSLGVTIDAGEPGGGTDTPDSDVWLALGAPKDGERHQFHFGVGARAVKVRYCRAQSPSLCPDARADTQEIRRVGDRKILRASGDEALEKGLTFSLVALDAQDRVVSTRLIKID